MRILKRNFKKGAQGYVALLPTDDEDLWHIYNLIQVDDHIKMKSPRKIVNVNETGLKNIKVKMLHLTLTIVQIDYFADGDRLAISIKGRNSQQNEYLKLGQYHTFCIELNTKITIYKSLWTMFEINLLKQISTINHNVEIAAMVMDEGIAHLCYVKPSITLLVQKVQKNISKKSAGNQIYQKSLGKFFENCYAALKTVDLANIKCFIIASPGFINEQFFKFIGEKSQNQNQKTSKKDLQKFLLVKCSTGYMGSLNEVLSDPKVQNKMQNTKAITQTKILDKFYDMMKKNQYLVAYGQKQVYRCIDMKSVATLLISDHLFRTKDLKKRIRYNKIVEQVRSYGGQAVIFSSLHPSGQKLKSITGIAALLRFEVEPLQNAEQQEQIIEANKQQGVENDEFKKMVMFSDDQDEDEEEEVEKKQEKQFYEDI